MTGIDADHRQAERPELMPEPGRGRAGLQTDAQRAAGRPDAGRELCRQAIHQYLSSDAPVDYERKLEPHQVEVHSEIRRLLQEKDL